MASIYLHSILADFIGKSEIEVPLSAPATLGSFLRENLPPKELHYIVDEAGRLRKHINIFIGSENIKWLDGLETSVEPEAEVLIFPAVSGG